MSKTTPWSEFLGEHYKTNKSKLMNRYRFLGPGAEDVIHDSYERAIRYANSFNGEEFDKWFNTILRNSMRDYRRMELNRPEEEDLDEFDHIGVICSGVSDRTWNEIVRQIERKPDNHKEVLLLYFTKGYSYKDIAAVTDNTYFNAYRIVERFMEELSQKYKE